ncbi:unnamed protein product [Bemisia tabaci]|uniref:Bleomycin hydrolase n=1 Tax=Bemisia tabaci TaxID=7038 RepID=A0A9P0G2K5_BEMTA|nr:unnamed protein product [Bemisia tabaci]
MRLVVVITLLPVLCSMAESSALLSDDGNIYGLTKAELEDFANNALTFGTTPPLSSEQLKNLREEFYSCPKNILAQNALSRVEVNNLCISRRKQQELVHVFNHKIEGEGKPVTNQKSTGRCWLFACLNTIRVPVVKQYNIEEFEFSQSYLFFWDKVERCHNYLNTIVEVANRGEKKDGRLLSFLFSDPIGDGGQWDMLVNLITKHGLMPKKVFPESYSSEASAQLNAILKSKLREYSSELYNLASQGNHEEIPKKIESQMAVLYRIIGICLGIPPETFTWEYYDKNKQYHSIGPITPLQFYQEKIKPIFNMEDKICIVNDPRETSGYGKALTVDCLSNMVGGRPVVYNNQPIEVLMNAAVQSIKNNEPVWYGCDVGKKFTRKLGFEDLDIIDYTSVFNTTVSTPMTKADRMTYGESAMTHAMVLTGVHVNEQGEPTKWRVENSWGDESGDKGYLLMTTDWFKEYVYELVVDKKYLSQEVLDVNKQKPQVLPAWDPMGTLAR